jgi:hypothetical protein
MAVAGRQRLAATADHRAGVTLQVAKAERREIGAHQLGKAVERVAHEAVAGAVFGGDVMEGAERAACLAPSQRGQDLACHCSTSRPAAAARCALNVRILSERAGPAKPDGEAQRTGREGVLE